MAAKEHHPNTVAKILDTVSNYKETMHKSLDHGHIKGMQRLQRHWLYSLEMIIQSIWHLWKHLATDLFWFCFYIFRAKKERCQWGIEKNEMSIIDIYIYYICFYIKC